MAVRAIPLGGVNRYGRSRKEVAPPFREEPLLFGDKRESPGWAATPGSPIRKYSDFHIDANCCVKRLILNQAFTHYLATHYSAVEPL
jgi:hypothetical protein